MSAGPLVLVFAVGTLLVAGGSRRRGRWSSLEDAFTGAGRPRRTRMPGDRSSSSTSSSDTSSSDDTSTLSEHDAAYQRDLAAEVAARRAASS